jgi:4-amino-4-deoxy-L-arabinose transferase-like glycosyltransferase
MVTVHRTWPAAHRRSIMLVVLLLGAGLRLIGLNQLSPPGLAHDEVAHWLINQDILSGRHSLYFAEAYGHEAGYHYLQAGFNWLLEANALALRLPSAFLGLLLVAICYTLIRRLFGVPTALLAAAILATLFWPIFYSRLGLRAISLPVASGLSAYFWWRGWRSAERHPHLSTNQPEISTDVKQILASHGSYILSGLLAGASLYTYMAARAVPIFYILFCFYLFIVQREHFRRQLAQIALFFVTMALVAAPIALFLLSQPGVEARISEIDRPLTALLEGDPGPALLNGLKILGMFGLRGDPLWRQNVARLPVFEPLTAALFYVGLVLCLWRWREPRYMFMVLWLSTSAIPSVVTIDAPSSIRIINALPLVTAFPVIGLQVIHFFRPLSTVRAGLSPISGRSWALIGLLAMAGLVLLHAGRTARATFVTWPRDQEVRFVWQQALTEMAAYLDEQPASDPAAIGGWSPETMDPPTMDLALRREDLALRYFLPGETLILPAGKDGQPIRVLRPTILPLHPDLEAQLLIWGVSPRAVDSFTLYELAAQPVPAPAEPAAVDFASELTFLGYDILGACRLGAAEPCRILTYWRVLQPAWEPRRFFLHLTGAGGEPVAQDDRLNAPSEHWRAGDLLLQPLELSLPPAGGPLEFRLGVYNPLDFRRLLTEEGRDFVLLPAIPLE